MRHGSRAGSTLVISQVPGSGRGVRGVPLTHPRTVLAEQWEVLWWKLLQPEKESIYNVRLLTSSRRCIVLKRHFLINVL